MRKGNVKTVQSVLGHANLVTTSIYVHTLDEDAGGVRRSADARGDPAVPGHRVGELDDLLEGDLAVTDGLEHHAPLHGAP